MEQIVLAIIAIATILAALAALIEPLWQIILTVLEYWRSLISKKDQDETK